MRGESRRPDQKHDHAPCLVMAWRDHPGASRVRRFPSLILAAVLALAVSACGGTQRVSMNLHGVSPLNVNDQNESTPVDVRFFALKSDAAFRSATVDALWTDFKKVLGDDLLGEPIVATVFPGGAGD